MQFDEIASQIKRFFERELPRPGIELTFSTNLLNDWFVDSFEIVNTALFLEKNFGIEMSRADINADTFHSVETLSRYVAKRLETTDRI